jgi:hypothetical protein
MEREFRLALELNQPQRPKQKWWWLTGAGTAMLVLFGFISVI